MGLAYGVIVEVDVFLSDKVLHALARAALGAITSTLGKVFSDAALVLCVETAVLSPADDRRTTARPVGAPDDAIGTHWNDKTSPCVSSVHYLDEHLVHVVVSAPS